MGDSYLGSLLPGLPPRCGRCDVSCPAPLSTVVLPLIAVEVVEAVKTLEAALIVLAEVVLVVGWVCHLGLG